MPTRDKTIEAEALAVSRIDAVTSILEVVCRVTGMGFAAVARVTEDRWIACAVRDEIAFGLKPMGELKVETTICDEIRDSGQAVIIDSVADSPAFCGHPTPAMYGFQSYISMPIYRSDKSFFGTLCAIDPKPAHLSRPEVVQMFKLFADMIAMHLDAHERMNASEAALLDERRIADFREQFIAVLGHDLRNPLASVQAGVRLVRKEKLSAKGAGVLDMVDKSVARMNELIVNVLDFARGRPGGGMALTLMPDAPISAALQQVVDEMRASNPDRAIEFNCTLKAAVACDPARVAQLTSNLLSNALQHGARDRPVLVEARATPAEFCISVVNHGAPISPDRLETIFLPFFRGVEQAQSKGLGLALYIAAEIARAHGGELKVTSTPEDTRFTFTLPRA